MTNKEISGIFKLLSKIMEIHDENAFKTRSYANAAFQIDQLHEPLDKMAPDKIYTLKGVGQAIGKKIEEIIETGELALLNNYLEKTPAGVIEFLKIKGIGGKKIGTIWRELEVESMGELLYACYENRLALLKGFGNKTQDNIIQAIEFIQANKTKFLFAELEPIATTLLKQIKEKLPRVNVSQTGKIRRKCITLEKIEIIIGATDQNLPTHLNGIEGLEVFWNGELIEGKVHSQIPILIYSCAEQDFFYRLWQTTGSKGHLEKYQIIKPGNYNSENEIYQALGLAKPEPEQREDNLNWHIPSGQNPPELITLSDIKGVIHTHTTYSDGTNTMEEMVKACIEKGFEYLGISDHSKSAFYASGLSVEEIKKQHAEIDQLNEKYAPFKIFKSIESDILYDGNLDYPAEILKSFDFVIASVHSVLKMTEEKANQRLLNAIKNPYTNILGHPTGRLLLSRPGYPIDHKKIIDACSEYGVVIEINANPYRLDLDWRWISYAKDMGVKICINPDAHSLDGIDDIYYGVCAGRKGGLTKEMTLNALSAEQFIGQIGKFAKGN